MNQWFNQCLLLLLLKCYNPCVFQTLGKYGLMFYNSLFMMGPLFLLSYVTGDIHKVKQNTHTHKPFTTQWLIQNWLVHIIMRLILIVLCAPLYSVPVCLYACVYVCVSRLLACVCVRTRVRALKLIFECAFEWVCAVPFIIVNIMLQSIEYEHWNDPLFLAQFVMACVAGFMINYATMLCTQYNSALTTSIVGVLKVSHFRIKYWEDDSHLLNWAMRLIVWGTKRSALRNSRLV